MIDPNQDIKTAKELMEAASATGYGATEFRPFAAREYSASRSSRGKADRVSAGGASRIAGVIGIVAEEGKKCPGYNGEGWAIWWVVRPPTSEDERDVCRRAMLGRWADRMKGVAYAGGPDDDRGRALWEARQRSLASTLAEVEAFLRTP